MTAISQIFFGLFGGKTPKPSDNLDQTVQTSLEPIHEQNANEGGEFLDDFSTLDEEQPEGEHK